MSVPGTQNNNIRARHVSRIKKYNSYIEDASTNKLSFAEDRNFCIGDIVLFNNTNFVKVTEFYEDKNENFKIKAVSFDGGHLSCDDKISFFKKTTKEKFIEHCQFLIKMYEKALSFDENLSK